MVIISFSLCKGGAAIAAHKFFRLFSDINDEGSVKFINQDELFRAHLWKRFLSFFLSKTQCDHNFIKHSLNLFSYPPVLKSFENTSDSLHHLHWINNDTLSIFDFNKIPSGSILTLHDEWLYCGAEHYYKVSDKKYDFINGYSFFKKDVYGLHWNYIIWRIKKNKLSNRRDLIYTVPSKWMLERAKSSMVLRNSDVRLLPNPIDTDVFKSLSSKKIVDFKFTLSLDNEDFIFCFGAIGGKKNFLKGAHLLDEALKTLHKFLSKTTVKRVKLIDFGGVVGESNIHGFHNISVGHISDPKDLALLYSVADCVIVPSMVESFGQVAAESLACSTPVICFDTSGLKDIVYHKKSGLMAESFSPNSLSECMLTMIEMSLEERRVMGEFGRNHVVEMFSYPIITDQYIEIINDAKSVKEKGFK